MIRAFAIVLLVSSLAAAPSAASASEVDPSPAAAGSTVDDDTTRPTINEFFPEERPLSDCLGALQRPNCGSDARGGWAQTAVFVLILAGLAFIAWRVVASSRRALRDQDSDTGDRSRFWSRAGRGRRYATVTGRDGPVTSRTPDATSAPDASDGDPTP